MKPILIAGAVCFAALSLSGCVDTGPGYSSYDRPSYGGYYGGYEYSRPYGYDGYRGPQRYRRPNDDGRNFRPDRPRPDGGAWNRPDRDGGPRRPDRDNGPRPSGNDGQRPARGPDGNGQTRYQMQGHGDRYIVPGNGE